MALLFFTLFFALLVLILSGRWMIRLLSVVTTSFGIPEFSVAFIFLAVATSLPELFVAISSSLQQAGGIVLAVALGSNVVNMTLIVGLATVMSLGISTAGLSLRRDVLLGGVITLLPLLFLLNGTITRFEGGLLLAAFFYYIFLLYRDQRRYAVARVPRRIFRGLGALVVALALVAVIVIAADQTVVASVELAAYFTLPPFLIGLFLLAIGTSLPELTTTLQSAWMRKPDLALGNILGSNVADSALIIGVASLIHPITLPFDLPLVLTGFFVVVALLLLGFFTVSKQRISFSEGMLLLACFLLFVSTTFLSGVSTVAIP